jgi:DnaK suppressor protein
MGQALTKAQLDDLRDRLLRERSRILGVLGDADDGGPEADQQTEFEEAAQRTTERAHGIAVAERERRLLGEVEDALSRMERGTYGVSDDTGEPIPYERLRAVPWTRRAAENLGTPPPERG